jgi:hypothetical protein
MFGKWSKSYDLINSFQTHFCYELRMKSEKSSHYKYAESSEKNESEKR